VLRSAVTMKLTDEARKLRAEVAILRGGRGRKYPSDLRRRILDWVDREVASGASESECGEALVVPMHRFELWRQRDREREVEQVPAEFVPVEVAAAVGGGLVLAMPGGYRVEGLTVAETIAMLKALR
jgi:hypothetical protein